MSNVKDEADTSKFKNKVLEKEKKPYEFKSEKKNLQQTTFLFLHFPNIYFML